MRAARIASSSAPTSARSTITTEASVSSGGSFSFTGGLSGDPARVRSTGISVADLLLGLPATAGGSSTSLAGNFNGFSHAFFIQDDWMVSHRLTMNLGLRCDLNTRFTDVQNRLTLFDPDFRGGRLLIAGSSNAYIPGRESPPRAWKRLAASCHLRQHHPRHLSGDDRWRRRVASRRLAT